MQIPASRSVVIISGLLTLLVLGGGTLAVAFHNGWLQTVSDTPGRDIVAASMQPSASMQNGTQHEVGVYRQKLEEAYQTLDDAYAQIRSLQSAQSQLAAARDDDDRFTEHDGDDHRRQRRSGRRESHDE